MWREPLKYGENFEIGLVCPDCGSEYSHQESVEVFVRNSEDSPSGLHVTVDGDVTINQAMYNNPSARRDGLRVAVRCEQCLYYFFLVVEQHKGVTHVYLTDTQVAT